MQTVNFNCPHCGNLMAVGTNLLGRNVRCPHCKQVVRAPSAAGEAAIASPAQPVPTPAPPVPAPTNLPQFNIPKPTDAPESIFGERHEEDLFGTEPRKPIIPAPVNVPPPPRPSPAPYLQETVSITEVAQRPHDTELESPHFEPIPESRPADPPTVRDRPAIESETIRPSSYSARAAKPEGASTGAFVWILFAYAAVITIAAGFFAFQYFTSGSGKHPFEEIPDFYGEYRKTNPKPVSFKNMPDPKLDVPPELRVKIGGELLVGDLEIRPIAVEWKPANVVEVRADGMPPPPDGRPAFDTLTLRLKVKNRSTSASFHPNDPAFNRAITSSGPPPYTALQQGNQFFHGPFVWPLDATTKTMRMEGQEADEQPLGPGQERETSVFVAPSGFRTAVSSLKRKDIQSGDSFLWRVQLRRGNVKVRVDGLEVEIATTAVIGVPFQGGDIR